MFRPRVIPCLLLHNSGLVKTVRFKDPKYLGDPINTVRIFNEKEVDEIMILDIDATRKKREPEYDLIADIVSEAFMPICYGGGVTGIQQMRRLFECGIEKLSLSTAAIYCPDIVQEAAALFGSQSIVVTLDIQRAGFRANYRLVTCNATQEAPGNPKEIAQKMAQFGAGELLLNFVDRDGTMEGYDISYIKQVAASVDVPVIALGGAGSLNDIKKVIMDGKASAAAAGSLFVFYGQHRAVLINYPSQKELSDLFGQINV